MVGGLSRQLTYRSGENSAIERALLPIQADDAEEPLTAQVRIRQYARTRHGADLG
jgi:hypothetical protein